HDQCNGSPPEVSSCSFYVFFFQAEDGIRDKLVTGVQTCALPICTCASPIANASRTRHPRGRGVRDRRRTRTTGPRPARPGLGARSEERRVGKEVCSGGGCAGVVADCVAGECWVGRVQCVSVSS